MARFLAKFGIVMALPTVVCALFWEGVMTRLYDCADGPGLPGYFTPGFWVHGWEGHPVASAPEIVRNRSMSEPDTVRNGWSTLLLLVVWGVLFSASLLVSGFAARRM